MKTLREFKYQTSDGRVFLSERKAKAHELSLFAHEQIGDGEKLTGPKIMQSMMDRPEEWIGKLREFLPQEPQPEE